MKKIFALALALVAFNFASAQDENESNDSGSALSKGSWVIEANTGSWAVGNTAFSLTSQDGNTAWSVGSEAGYFVMDNLALKAGLGYSDAGIDGVDGTFTYKVGAKYYLGGKFPVGADFTGASTDGNSVSFVGLQAGYGWFVAKNISIEPTLRYNVSTDEDKADSAFQGLIGFALHF